MRKIILFLIIISAIVLVGLWKFRILEPVIWKLFTSVEPIQKMSQPFIKFRPRNLTKDLVNSDKKLAQLIDGPIDKNKVKIVISKSEYKLTLLYDRESIKEYMIVMGGDPVNDKLREGDKRTPEGKFKVRDLYPHKSWSKFIWINYPTQDSWQKHNEAKANGEISTGDTIGGEIGIHGVPAGNDLLVIDGVNWTTGCVSLTNKDINEIYDVMKVGTPVTITH